MNGNNVERSAISAISRFHARWRRSAASESFLGLEVCLAGNASVSCRSRLKLIFFYSAGVFNEDHGNMECH